MTYKIVFTKEALKDVQKLKMAGLDIKAKGIIEIVKENPFKNPPTYEKLQGKLSGVYFRRLNIQHRFVYQVYEKEKTVKIISMWSHYE